MDHHDTSERLAGIYQCLRIDQPGGQELTSAHFQRGYRSLVISGLAHDFFDFGRGVILREGKRYRILIEEIK